MVKSLRSYVSFLAVFLFLHEADLSAATRKKKPPAEPASPVRQADPDEDASATPAPAKTGKAIPRATRVLAEGELPLLAKGAVVLDAYTGQALYEKSADEPYFPASTTKIMTALLVIESGDLDREVEITLEDSKVGESSLNLLPGDHYTRRDMLFGLMLKSANDVAHALGRDNAGTAEAFAEKMTQRAKELGALNTSFRNPNGLHDPQHYTTARDLAIIARAAMQQPYFRQVVGTKNYMWKRPTGELWQLTNHNRLLGVFPGTTGVKTGFTNPAQQVLVSACLRNNREVIAVVMKDSKPNNWEDSRVLLNYGLDHPPGNGPVPRFQ